jgi:glycosyltransferase involved in cell wall biosynthesis
MRTVFVEMKKLKTLHSGLGQFCLHLGRALSQQSSPELEYTFYVPPSCKGVFGSTHRYKASSELHKLVPLSLKPYQVWHCTHQEAMLPTLPSTKVVLTIHDLNFLERDISSLKKKRYLSQVQKRVDRAAAITVISEYTASVVKQHLRIPNIPFKVIYNGTSMEAYPDAVPPPFLVQGNFLFSIGIIGPKKNFHVLLPLLKAHPELKLVLAGINTHPYAAHIQQEAAQLGVAEQLVMPGPVDDATRYWLYKNCLAFVFPSLSEGFGLPAIEAMSLGKPVFLSDRTSLPEIGGPEAFYWHNFEPQHMLQVFDTGMEAYERDKDQKAQRLTQWAARYSWDTAAKAYIQLYTEL